MAMQTHELYGKTIKALGAEVVADELGVGVQHVYKLAQDPQALDAPIRNDAKRIMGIMSRLAANAADPECRACLILWSVFWTDFIARVRDREVVTPLTCEELPRRLEVLCREFADLVHTLGPNMQSDRIMKEGAELIAATEMLMRCSMIAQDLKKPTRTPLRAS